MPVINYITELFVQRLNSYFARILIVFMIPFFQGCSSEVPDAGNKKRNEIDLTVMQWNIWPDTMAQWKNDRLYLPPVNPDTLPYNPPTCGWEKFYEKIGIKASIPATVEEYFWEENDALKPLKGDYKGVSWFYTQINIPENMEGQRVMLDFESVRLRAEIYINERLAGYDCIGNTPFQVDVSKYLKYGKQNWIAVRITDPGGNFGWEDYHIDRWGDANIPPSHGFGGITGNVKIFSTDNVFINDVFIKNRPSINDVELLIQMVNLKEISTQGKLYIKVLDNQTGNYVLDRVTDPINLDKNLDYNMLLYYPDAKAWSVKNPYLYTLEIIWEGMDGTSDIYSEQFGFRWFEVRDVAGDKQFFLNNERIFIVSAISWGFWPVNGIFPEPEWAEKQVDMAKLLGLNMLNFHRAIGDPLTMDIADKNGLLLCEEPGGYRCPSDNIWFWAGDSDTNKLDTTKLELAWNWRKEKLMRMIRRDRNHPSLVIYSLSNEILHDPDENNKKDIFDAHLLDPTRIIIYSSNTYDPAFMKGYDGTCPENPAPAKLFMMPYDTTFHFQGWWDEHHALGPGCYIDLAHYNNPESYSLNTNHREEIIFYGEEAAIGGPSRFMLIRDELTKNLYNKGWDGNHYITTGTAFKEFLEQYHFTNGQISADDYIVSMGNVAYYYHGRMIENCRINDIVDAYVVNGWENSRENIFSGLVDIFRYPKGDPQILSYYNQPLYLAVKLRNKVLPSRAGTMADIYIVNQANIEGEYVLNVTISDETNHKTNHINQVFVKGNNQFGQLLQAGIPVNPIETDFHGYVTVNASLFKDQQKVTSGSDNLFFVRLPEHIPGKGQVLDESGILIRFLKQYNDIGLYKGGVPEGNYLILGQTEQAVWPPELINWIESGNSVLVCHDADKWLNALPENDFVRFIKKKELGNWWFGGHFFVKEHPMFKELPVNTAFNWEYQVFARYSANRFGLLIDGDEVIAGAIHMEDPEIAAAAGIIPFGKGKIIFSTLDILPNLNTDENAAVVARKLLCNYIEYALNSMKIQSAGN